VPIDDPVQMAAQPTVAEQVRGMLGFVVKTSVQGLVCGENPIAFAPGAYTTFSAAGGRSSRQSIAGRVVISAGCRAMRTWPR
jgi:hypothetical protein